MNKLISYIYKSCFKVQQKLQNQLAGNLRWLEMLRSDTELIKYIDGSLESLQQKAVSILNTIDSTIKKDRISTILFKKYDKAKKPEVKSAIVDSLLGLKDFIKIRN